MTRRLIVLFAALAFAVPASARPGKPTKKARIAKPATGKQRRTGTSAKGSKRIGAALARRAPAVQAKKLVKLGYQGNVAERIARDTPALASKLLSLAARKETVGKRTDDGRELFFVGEKAWEPVTVYRGLATTRYNANHKNSKYKGDVYVTRALIKARWYGSNARNRKEHGLVVEMQVPRFLLRLGNNRELTFSVSETGGHRAFIARVGTIAPRRERRERAGEVSWVKDPTAVANLLGDKP